MTFEEIGQSLPNGFHDAVLRGISVDFESRRIVLQMEILVGVPDAPDPEEYRPAALHVSPSYMIFADAPDPRYPFASGGSLNVQGHSATAGKCIENLHKIRGLLAALPSDATAYGFFIEEWNSSLYLAGGSVELVWERPRTD